MATPEECKKVRKRQSVYQKSGEKAFAKGELRNEQS
jgi:hypothetical protein